jgi:murein DD-endopeptidase MepM/ murein hydrolase activator NlpD
VDAGDTRRHIAIVIPRPHRESPLVLSVAPLWGWVLGLLVLSLLVAASAAVFTYARAMQRLRDYSALAVEVETLRRQNQTVQQLEDELKELRALQQRMLHLAGIRTALGVGAPPPDMPGTDPIGEAKLFFWPVEGAVLRQHSESHAGVDIEAPRKRPVIAAGDGVVREAARDKALGHRIVLAHGDSLQTVYANNEMNLVAVGDTVEAGQVIALVGQGPEGPTPHLHFEVWRGGQAVRPRDLIPDLFTDE